MEVFQAAPFCVLDLIHVALSFGAQVIEHRPGIYHQHIASVHMLHGNQIKRKVEKHSIQLPQRMCIFYLSNSLL